jgi:hypothetical protein
MLSEIPDISHYSPAVQIVIIVISALGSFIGVLFFLELITGGDFLEGLSDIIVKIRGPRVIVTHNICPKCQKIKTQEINNE